MQIYLSALLCLLAVSCTAQPKEQAADKVHTPSFEQIRNRFNDFFLSQEEKILRCTTRCAGLSLANEEQKRFEAAYKVLGPKREWIVLVDPSHVLAKDYRPQDLVDKWNTGWPKRAQLRGEAMEQMMKMIEAAQKDGVRLVPISTYRTWQYQDRLYQQNLARNNGKPNGYVARAGESQHHLGTAVDFNTVNPADENIPALIWLRKHAGEYGFSLSFPKEAEAEKESGYPYEAWHYRYITREAVRLQDEFFNGNQHKTLTFLNDCYFAQQAQ